MPRPCIPGPISQSAADTSGKLNTNFIDKALPSKVPLWRVTTVMWRAVESSRATLLSNLAKPDASSLDRIHCPMCPYSYRIHALIVFSLIAAHM
jgi:hypothetical protein